MAGRSADDRELKRLEGVIEKAQAFDLEACYALRDIWAARHYRRRFNNWDMYVRTRWDLTVGSAFDRIRAAYVMDALAEAEQGTFRALPSNFAQAVALTKWLQGSGCRPSDRGYSEEEKEEIRATWGEVLLSGRGKPTAALIESKSAARRLPAPLPSAAVMPPSGIRFKTLRLNPESDVRRVARTLCEVYPIDVIDVLISEILACSGGRWKLAA